MNKRKIASQPYGRLTRGVYLILTLTFTLFSICGIAAAQNFGVSADQNSGEVQVTGLQVGEFPVLRFLLEVKDGLGDPVNGIQPDQIQVMEDGYVRPILELNRIEPGLQLLLAVNESPNLTNQYQGVSYYRLLMQRLESWAQSLPADDPSTFSYVTNSGVQIAQMEDPVYFARALEAYQPDLMAARPGLTSLTMALDLTTNPLPDPYMKRAILYVTPMLDAASREALPMIAERAAQLGTRVFIWVIAPGYPLEAVELEQLRQLADSSGGEIFLSSGTEDFPDPESYFDPLRYIYQVAYESGVNSSGEHRLVTSVTRPDLQITGDEVVFSINVTPPNPIFMDPPVQIQRSFTEVEGEENRLEPDTYPLQILVEFPDGYQRGIRYTRLYINDEVALENTSPPFDRFDLPLSGYDHSQQLELQVEVEDELGLNQRSIETLVELIVEEPQQTWFAAFLSGRRLITLVSLVVAALILVLVILLSSQRNTLRAAVNRFRRSNDPVKQQVTIRTEQRKKNSAALDSPTVRKVPEPVNAPAKLVRLSEDGNPIPQRVIPLIRRETTLGADPQQAVCVLDSPTVSPLHARIRQDDTGCFYVDDAGSIAGTWVNYDPVCEHTTRLEHSDIVHFGLMAFRFEINQPTSVRKPTVTPYQAD
jgi:hypothetical protein